jgi:hypothetical protein
MGQMVCALDSLISHSYSRYVRAFILSDFFHHSPTGVQERLNPEAYSDVRNHLNEICRTKNVAISLLVLPPASSKGGYSLEELKSLLPASCIETFGVSPDQRTVDYLMSKVEAMDRLRGLSDDVADTSSPIATYIILGVFLLALAALAGFYLAKSINSNNQSITEEKTKVIS